MWSNYVATCWDPESTEDVTLALKGFVVKLRGWHTFFLKGQIYILKFWRWESVISLFLEIQKHVPLSHLTPPKPLHLWTCPMYICVSLTFQINELIETTAFCCRIRVVITIMQMSRHDCAPIKHYKTSARCICFSGKSLPIPGLVKSQHCGSTLWA